MYIVFFRLPPDFYFSVFHWVGAFGEILEFMKNNDLKIQ